MCERPIIAGVRILIVSFTSGSTNCCSSGSLWKTCLRTLPAIIVRKGRCGFTWSHSLIPRPHPKMHICPEIQSGFWGICAVLQLCQFEDYKKKKRSFFFLNYIKLPNVKFVSHCYNVIQSEIGQNPFNRFSTSTTSAGTCRPITHPTNPGGWLSRLMFPSPLRRKENSSESSGMAKLPGEGMVK